MKEHPSKIKNIQGKILVYTSDRSCPCFSASFLLPIGRGKEAARCTCALSDGCLKALWNSLNSVPCLQFKLSSQTARMDRRETARAFQANRKPRVRFPGALRSGAGRLGGGCDGPVEGRYSRYEARLPPPRSTGSGSGPIGAGRSQNQEQERGRGRGRGRSQNRDHAPAHRAPALFPIRRGGLSPAPRSRR